MQIIRRIKRSIKGENKFRKVANEWLEYKKNSIKNSTYYNYKFIIEKYLNKLSTVQRKIVSLLSEGYKAKEIRESLHMSEKEYSQNLAAIQAYENVRELM